MNRTAYCYELLVYLLLLVVSRSEIVILQRIHCQAWPSVAIQGPFRHLGASLPQCTRPDVGSRSQQRFLYRCFCSCRPFVRCTLTQAIRRLTEYDPSTPCRVSLACIHAGITLYRIRLKLLEFLYESRDAGRQFHCLDAPRTLFHYVA